MKGERKPKLLVTAALFLFLLFPSSAADWRNMSQGTDQVSGKVDLSVEARDSENLTQVTLATNETGEWRNKSIYGSPDFPYTSGKYSTIVFTWQNSSYTDRLVSWKVWIEGNSSSNVTGIKSFQVDKGSEAKYKVGIEDERDNELRADFVVERQGSQVASGSGYVFEELLEKNRNYTVRHTIPTSEGDFKVTFWNFNLTQQASPRTQLVNSLQHPSVTAPSRFYAVDDSSLKFSKATLKIPKNGQDPDTILHCTSFDFDTSECNRWDVRTASDYSYRETSDYFIFNVTGFDAFGTGVGEPLPNITEVTVHEVSGLSPAQKEVAGTLEAQGLNDSFEVIQADKSKQYRFSFKIVNQGEQDWSVEASDKLFHNGLNDTWTVDKIWYNFSSTGDKDGGSFSDEKVTWDTSNGGVLQSDNSNDTMYAKYLVTIDTERSRLYDQRFFVNDTSEAAGSQDFHKLDHVKLGLLDISLSEPPNDTVVEQNKTFVINSTARCRKGECGTVTMSTRFNQSVEAADTLIPEGSGEPFHLEDVNTETCSSDLKFNQTCFLNWTANATGEFETYHRLDANASSDFSSIEANDSQDHFVQINSAIQIDVTWDFLSFGALDPGEENVSAEGNSESLYNVSIGSDSLTVDDLWVRATELASESLNYTIDQDNLSFSLQNDIDTEKQLSSNYKNVKSDISPGSNVTTFYWIDVPTGITKGEYTGTIFFKANSTVR